MRTASRREFVRWLVAAGAGAAVAPLLEGTAGAATVPGAVAVVGATLIDGTGQPPQADMTVVLVGDAIVWVGQRQDAVVPEGAQVVDARGRFVIPGLWDMHTHMTATAEAVYPPLYLANGVTGIRDMWGDAALHDLRRRIDAGSVPGPRIVIASDIIDGPYSVWPDATQVATPAAGREAVRAAKAAGADFIKVYSFLDGDSLAAIIDEGRLLGLPVAGHLPWRVAARQASVVGMRSFEHLYGLPIAASAREAEIRQLLAETPIDPAQPRRFYDFARELDREASLAHDPAKAWGLYRLLAGNGTWQVPTLTILQVASSPADTYQDDPRLKYVPADVRAYWEQRIGELTPSTPEEIAQQAAFLSYRLGEVGEMARAGVRILGGTDTPNPYTFAGFSTHDELELLVAAGLSPMRALQCMTGEAADFLGLRGAVGTVSPGAAADLVVLDADPLRDIRNTRRIHAVVARGRLLDRQRLDTMLADVERAVGTAVAA